MRTLLTSLVALILWYTTGTQAQVKLNEDFESGPTPTLPSGWGVWNAASFIIDSTTNWTVRDSGQALPGLSTALSKAHSGIRAAGVSWWSSIDTVTGTATKSDAWLITRRIMNIQAGDSLRFWATGGTMNYLDSLQIWIGDADSTPAAQVLQLGSIIWPVGSTYGRWNRYAYDLSFASGFNLYVGFRYFMDCAVDGFFVHVDDVYVGGPTSVTEMPLGFPAAYELSQNYPNPFNPSTKIAFRLRDGGFTSLKVFDMLGRELATLANGQLKAGSYEATWDASGLSSGTYFYQLRSGNYVEMKKMMLLR